MPPWLEHLWFKQRRPRSALWLLLPFHLLFIGVAALRRRRLPRQRLKVPVVIVGNLTVGGTGKTPLVLALAEALQSRGWRPGIVSRGHGRRGTGSLAVKPDSDPSMTGDEPLLLARRSALPVHVGRDRVAAARSLLAENPDANLILCDDGLQHYRLERDVEIAVFDGRGAGNGWRLPLGPLREALARLSKVDAVVFNGAPDARIEAVTGPVRFSMTLRPGLSTSLGQTEGAELFYRLDQPEKTCAVSALRGKTLHAVAGMGDPARFFRTLESLELEFSRHPFPDHHAYTAADLDFARQGVLLMTEKDAVKCAALPLGEAWVLPVAAEVPSALVDLIVEKLRGRKAS